ncbi:Glutathione peroxidase [Globisporangium polare]
MRKSMMKKAAAVLLAALVFTFATVTLASGSDGASLFGFFVDDIAGNPVPLERFADKKAILVVNVASSCGYTDQNYRELQTLYEKYQSQGLEILAFPCNQFGAQEPGTPDQILSFVQQNYHVTFPVFAKVNVNGADAHPVFKFLKQKLSGFITDDIKWNFSKFLVVDGVPFKRYATTTSPFDMEQDIAKALEGAKSAKEGEETRQEL